MTSEVEAEHSMSSRVYRELRTRIIHGDFPPGTRLRERELAEEFEVSRIPLREALPQLEADGFITTSPRRGAVVHQLTIQDVEELFDVRVGVEVYATRLAARRIAGGASPEPIELALARADDALHNAEKFRIVEQNSALHDAIVDFSGNSLLISMMGRARARHLWIFGMTPGSDPQQACLEHRRLCAALYAGDEELASALAYAHIEQGRAPALQALRNVLPVRDSPGPA